MTRCRTLLATTILIGGSVMPRLVGTAFASPASASPAIASPAIVSPPVAAAALQARPPLAPEIASVPLVTGGSPAAERINRSIAAAEQQLRNDIKACRAEARDGEASSGWSRTVTITSNGPSFLSFLADDLSFCGGPYPNADRSALVYDLRSGQPVDWHTLLPARFAVRARGSWASDGGTAGPVKSLSLLKLYRQHYPARVADIDPFMREACRESVEDGFTVWPDASAHALMIQPTPQNHAAAACAVPVALHVPVLREAGAPSRLLDGLGGP